MRCFSGLRSAAKNYVSTPIFYVNASPHIGHLYSMVLADVAHRFAKLRNVPSILSTGTDEHGTKVQRAAAKCGEQPQPFVDRLSQQFRDLAHTANIDYSRFIRTSDADHVAEAMALWRTLQSRGLVYMSKHTGWYCVSDETFYPESELTTDAATQERFSVESGNPVEWYEEENWFFKLSALQPQLIELFESRPDFVVPRARHLSLLNELKTQPLQDLSISRPVTRCSWGIPVPQNQDCKRGSEHTMYVWFEALVNYLTVARQFGINDYWPATHIIGKDIVRFHAVYWPAFLIAAGLAPPNRVVVHSHWTLEGAKMSKSKQNVVDPFYAMEKYGLDSVRYVLCHDMSLAHDSPFSYERLIERHNVNLVNKWGNLAARVCGPKFSIAESLPALRNSQYDGDASLREQCTKFAANFEFGRYAQVINDFGMAANVAVQEAEPWTNPQSENSRLAIALAAERCRVMAILLQPICPEYSNAMLNRLAVSPAKRSLEYADIGADLNYGVGANRKGEHVLQRI